MKKLSALLLGILLLVNIVACAAPVDDAGGTTTTSATTTTTSTISDDLSTPSSASKSTIISARPSTHVPTSSTHVPTSLTSTTTSVENWPSKNERQELIERYVYYTTLYESSMIDFLVELGLGTRQGIEGRLTLSPSTGVREQDFVDAIGETVVIETHCDRFLAENELDNGEIFFVRPEKPLMSKMVGGIKPNGTTTVRIYGSDYTGYIYTVTVDVADGTMEVYDLTVVHFFDKYVVADCKPAVK